MKIKVPSLNLAVLGQTFLDTNVNEDLPRNFCDGMHRCLRDMLRHGGGDSSSVTDLGPFSENTEVLRKILNPLLCGLLRLTQRLGEMSIAKVLVPMLLGKAQVLLCESLAAFAQEHALG